MSLDDYEVLPSEDWLDDPEWAELWDSHDWLIEEVIDNLLADMDEGGYF